MGISSINPTRTFRLSALLLAAVILPCAVPSTAAAATSACRGEIASYCKNIYRRNVTSCLLGRWGLLSQDCRESLVDSPENPCQKEIRSYCQKVDPKTSLSDCLKDNQHRLSAKCKKNLFENLSRNPCYPAAKKFCGHLGPGPSFSKILSCLLPHTEDISPSCFLSMRSSPQWPNVCEKDVARFCSGNPMDTPEKRAAGVECLLTRVKELAPLCRETVLWNPCASSAQALCSDQPPRQSRACLLQNKAKLPPLCQKALALQQAGPPTKP